MHWKKALREMKPYKPGKSINEVMEQYQIHEVIKLASNENPYGYSSKVKDVLQSAILEHHIYPDGNAMALRKKLQTKLGVDGDALLFGGGSDEIIMMIARALLEPGKNSVMATPTFPQYAHAAKIEGAEIKEIPLKDGTHDLQGFLTAIDDQTAVVWICNPNNPTGCLVPSEDLYRFLKKVPNEVLVVVDEAYFEYITDENYIDTTRYLQEFNNLLILRTFSKAYGLAAFRVGYAIGHPIVLSNLNKVRNPFNVTSIGLLAAETAIDDEQFIEACRKSNQQQRERFIQFANENHLHIFPSETNFVCMEVQGNSDKVAEALLRQGLIIRSGDALGIPGTIRVTIGTEHQNTKFFKALHNLLKVEGLLK